MVKKVFTVGDLVFGKVKGYPAWPAKVTGRTCGGKYCVFFYGTFEVGNMKPEEMWPYNQKFREKFGPPNMRKKWYSEGLYQIEHTPEIALQQLGLNEDDVIKRDSSSQVATAEVTASPVAVALTLPEISVVSDKAGSDMDRVGMSGLTVFKEASSFLAEAREWTEEKVYSNASCILECARVVLKNSVSAQHGEKFDCIKWLGLLARFVPSFNLETELLEPILSSVNEFLDNIIASLDDDCGADVKSGLLDMVTILLGHTVSVLDITRKHSGFGIADVPSLMKYVPQILQKTITNMDQGVGWKCKVREIIIFFLEMIDSVNVRAVFQEELTVFNNLLGSLIDLQLVLVSLDLKLTMLVCSATTNLATKYSRIMPTVKYNTAMEKVCWRLCTIIVWTVENQIEKLTFMQKMSLQFKPSTNCQTLEDLNDLLLLFSEVSPHSSLLSLEDRKQVTSLLKNFLGVSLWDIDIYQSLQAELSLWWVNFTRKSNIHENMLDTKCEGLENFESLMSLDSVDKSVTEDSNNMVDPDCEGLENFDSSIALGDLTSYNDSDRTRILNDGICSQVIEKEDGFELTSKSHFQLSASFPIIPISQSECHHLPASVFIKSPPDLACCVPIPGANFSFFILSSLVPIEQSKSKVPTKQPPTKRNKKQKSKKQRESYNLFENKVKKSKLITQNLQKQRHSNLLKFKSAIKEVNGVFKCSVCSFETGWKSKAWSHSNRCGLNVKKAPRKPKVKTCSACKENFQAQKDLNKHFRSEHQTSSYFCVLCPKPTSFKFKNSFKRHCQLKHNKSHTATTFKCSWCRYQATQKTNLKRHIQRLHKNVRFAVSLLDHVIEEAIIESGLCEYEKIRLNNLREKRKVFLELFPDGEFSSQSPVQGKKVSNRVVSQKSRISPRLVLDPFKDGGSFLRSDTCATLVSDVNVDQDEVGTSKGNVTKQYSCIICEFKCRRKDGLLRHIVKKHQSLNEPLSCPRSFCELSFSTRWQKESHVAECWLICPQKQCKGKQFRRQDKFNQHLRMHQRMDDLIENS